MIDFGGVVGQHATYLCHRMYPTRATRDPTKRAANGNCAMGNDMPYICRKGIVSDRAEPTF